MPLLKSNKDMAGEVIKKQTEWMVAHDIYLLYSFSVKHGLYTRGEITRQMDMSCY